MKAYYVNRQDREDRNYLFRGAMAASGFEAGELVRFIAKNKEDYPSREELCNAACQDGFDEFFGYQIDKEWPGYGHLICSWSVMRCWRTIAESDEMSLFFLDDYYLKSGKKWELEKLIETLGDVRILQLAWHARDDVFFVDEYKLGLPFEVVDLQVSDKSESVYVGSSHGCSDWAFVFSPDGAQLMLDYMKYHPQLNTECVLTGLHHTFKSEKGIYSVVDNDPKENGTMVLQNNAWVGHLVEYTEGNMSDLVGTHEKGDV